MGYLEEIFSNMLCNNFFFYLYVILPCGDVVADAERFQKEAPVHNKVS